MAATHKILPLPMQPFIKDDTDFYFNGKKCTLGKQLGSGSYGDVFLLTADSTQYAVKIFQYREQFTLDENDADIIEGVKANVNCSLKECEFYKQVYGFAYNFIIPKPYRVVAKLEQKIVSSHPYVATLIPYFEGTDLTTDMEHKKPVSCLHYLQFQYLFWESIQAVHAKGVVHLDIASRNIIVQKDEKENIQSVKLIDFSISQWSGTSYILPEWDDMRNFPPEFPIKIGKSITAYPNQDVYMAGNLLEKIIPKKINKILPSWLCFKLKCLQEKVTMRNPEERMSVAEAIVRSKELLFMYRMLKHFEMKPAEKLVAEIGKYLRIEKKTWQAKAFFLALNILENNEMELNNLLINLSQPNDDGPELLMSAIVPSPKFSYYRREQTIFLQRILMNFLWEFKRQQYETNFLTNMGKWCFTHQVPALLTINVADYDQLNKEFTTRLIDEPRNTDTSSCETTSIGVEILKKYRIKHARSLFLLLCSKPFMFYSNERVLQINRIYIRHFLNFIRPLDRIFENSAFSHAQFFHINPILKQELILFLFKENVSDHFIKNLFLFDRTLITSENMRALLLLRNASHLVAEFIAPQFQPTRSLGSRFCSFFRSSRVSVTTKKMEVLPERARVDDIAIESPSLSIKA